MTHTLNVAELPHVGYWFDESRNITHSPQEVLEQFEYDQVSPLVAWVGETPLYLVDSHDNHLRLVAEAMGIADYIEAVREWARDYRGWTEPTRQN